MLIFYISLAVTCSYALICVPTMRPMCEEKEPHTINHLASVTFRHLCGLSLGINVEVENGEIIKKYKTPIIVMNHQCGLDLLPVYVFSF